MLNSVVQYYLSRTVPNDKGCLIWQGAVSSSGYPHATRDQKSLDIHRYIAFQVAGREPDLSLVVMHSCDNKLCINPDHLEIGTQSKNNRDALARGRRQPRNHPFTKLDVDKVLEIRRLYAQGERQTTIARYMGIGQPTVSKIVRGEDWAIM